VFEALQAPACHENMVKVGGYILGEFGNLIAGDSRSSPLIQFELLHSKYHLCTPQTRCLLLSTYVKFINLFNEIKPQIQDVLKQDANIRSADVEIQQRTIEYLRLSEVVDTDVLATVLEEMPAFPERESSILSSILQKKKPPSEAGGLKEDRHEKAEKQTSSNGGQNGHEKPMVGSGGSNGHQVVAQVTASIPNSQSIDLLGLNFGSPVAPKPPSSIASAMPTKSDQEALLDIFGGPPSAPPHNMPPPPPAAVTTTPLQHYQPQLPTTGGYNNLDNLFSNTFDVPVVSATTPTSHLPPFTPILAVADNTLPFVFKNADVLHECASLQIAVKCEFKQNLGRVTLTFTNKSAHVFQGFVVSPVSRPGEDELLRVIIKPAEQSSVPASGGQLAQIINLECVNTFDHRPEVTVQFSCAGVHSRFQLVLPVFVNKFFDATQMDSQTFFSRWRNLGK
jgi:AP-2 complex subunit alpha